MELLASKVPERRAACQEKIVALRQIDYDAARPDGKAAAGEALLEALLSHADALADAGDAAAAIDPCRKALGIATALKSDMRPAILARMDRLTARAKTDQKVAAIRARLAAAPADAAVRTELVKALLVDLDDPAEAATVVDASLEPALQKYVPAAARGVEQTPELACVQLGDWYRGLADQAPPAAKPAMIARARAYYQRFLSLHAAEDVERAQAVLTLKKLDEAAGGPPRPGPAGKAPAAGPDALAAGQWHDILKLVDTTRDPATGSIPLNWQRQGAAVVCANPGYDYSHITVPVVPQGSYEVQATFSLGRSHGHVGLYLPAGSASVLLHIDGSGPSGLEYVNNQPVYMTGAATVTTLAVSRAYTVEARVTLKGDQAEILAALDGKPIVRWSGPQSALSAYYHTDKRCLGLRAYYTTATFGALRLRPLGEEARLRSDPKASPWPTPPSKSGPTPAPAPPAGKPAPPAPGK
ncbi:MAG: hypothetical protein FJ288_14970 [Planctomycetes bacterium]|nr:hypothetical protein [Planctomycetota bacterium]